jgi:hypothetical protein
MAFVSCSLCCSGCDKCVRRHDAIESEEEAGSRRLIVVSDDEKSTSWSWVTGCSRGAELAGVLGMVFLEEIMGPAGFKACQDHGEDFAKAC